MRAQLAKSCEKFLLVHVVLECLASVNENDRNLVVELAAKFGVEVDIHFVPGEKPPRRESFKRLSLTTSHRWHPLGNRPRRCEDRACAEDSSAKK